MSALILILGWITLISEVIWYFTCTEHKNVPLILVYVVIIFGLIPGLNLVLSGFGIMALSIMANEDIIELKNNWFNRKFLAYHE